MARNWVKRIFAKDSKIQPMPKKDYAYRSTWEHQLSRARNLAQRGGLTKTEMLAQYGRFPRKNEWWGPEKNRQEWERAWTQAHPKPFASTGADAPSRWAHGEPPTNTSQCAPTPAHI